MGQGTFFTSTVGPRIPPLLWFSLFCCPIPDGQIPEEGICSGQLGGLPFQWLLNPTALIQVCWVYDTTHKHFPSKIVNLHRCYLSFFKSIACSFDKWQHLLSSYPITHYNRSSSAMTSSGYLRCVSRLGT